MRKAGFKNMVDAAGVTATCMIHESKMGHCKGRMLHGESRLSETMMSEIACLTTVEHLDSSDRLGKTNWPNVSSAAAAEAGLCVRSTNAVIKMANEILFATSGIWRNRPSSELKEIPFKQCFSSPKQ
jgi:hypothetical protein